MRTFAVLDQPNRRTAVVHALVEPDQLPAFCSRALGHVLAAMEAQGTLPAGEPFVLYHGAPNGTVDVEAGFPILGAFVAAGEVVPSALPAGRLVTGMHRGPYHTLASTCAAMRDWATGHGWRPTGELWEVYLTDPEREPDPGRWRTEVFLRVT
jgi:effector-binding domain-containing protein